MKVEIKKSVFEKFHSNFMVGLLVCSDLNNKSHLKEIHSLLEDVENLIKLNFSPITLKTHDLITVWEAAVEGFAGKKHYCSAVETMMRSVLEGHKIKPQTKLKDLCNFVSLKHLVPVDCFDLSLMKGSLDFDVKGKELVFSNEKNKLSEKLALKRNKKFDLSEETKKAAVYLEALPPVTEAKAKKIAEELADLIETYCKAKVKVYFLNRKNPEVKI